MMKKISPLIYVPAQYGLVATLLGASLLITLFYVGKHPFLIPVYFDFRIFLFAVFIFFAMKDYRENYNNGVLFFWQGMVGSYAFTLAFAILASGAITLFGMLEKDFVQQYIHLFTEQVKTYPKEVIERIGKENFESNLRKIPSTNAFDLGLTYFMQSLMIGFFLSIIVTVILRKQSQN
jgi:Protein of unknown function (DUF4199)